MSQIVRDCANPGLARPLELSDFLCGGAGLRRLLDDCGRTTTVTTAWGRAAKITASLERNPSEPGSGCCAVTAAGFGALRAPMLEVGRAVIALFDIKPPAVHVLQP